MPEACLVVGDARRIPLADGVVHACATSPPYWGKSSLLWYNINMRDCQGRFVKGYRSSPSTEFLKGQHWRKPKPFWGKAWLEEEYVIKQKSAQGIAKEQHCTENAILFWLEKHSIPRRTPKEARALFKVEMVGEQNGMFGKRGSLSPHWKGGCTPDRQAFYGSPEWAKIINLIWDRDKAMCQRCRKRAKGKTFHIHHRISFNIKTVRQNLGNLVLLCPRCHRWVHSKVNSRKEYLHAFQDSLL